MLETADDQSRSVVMGLARNGVAVLAQTYAAPNAATQINHEDAKERKMEQQSLFITSESLFEQLCSTATLYSGFEEVKKNKGAPGIDGQSIEEFDTNAIEELRQLSKELRDWTYKPQPVRRVEIPKATGGVRLLGVPCIRDRVVQSSLKLLIEPLLEPTFSEHSYGFRPNRSQHMAIKAAQSIVASGKLYVVDLDMSKFFDRINHDRLISRLGNHIPDKRILRLIGMILRSGVMTDGKFMRSTEGAPQGGPLSPLLSNVVLDELDKSLEARGLSFCRFADDCNIFVKSRKAAERVMQKTIEFIENKLKLVVNKEKSHVGLSHEVKFLGMTIVNSTIAISKKAMDHAMEKVKELTPRGTYLNLEAEIKRINRWYVGWSNYYSLTQYPAQLKKIEAHIRRRLRSRLISQQKRRKHLYYKLIKRGASRRRAELDVFSNKGRWALSNASAVLAAYTNNWFKDEMGLAIRSDQEHAHWFNPKLWITLT
jgi:group II intron reverse transcriptase/maturase